MNEKLSLATQSGVKSESNEFEVRDDYVRYFTLLKVLY